MVKNTTAVDEAKAVIASYEKHTKAVDLGGVVFNAAEGVVLLASEAPLLEGKAALKQFCKHRCSWGVRTSIMIIQVRSC